jgi:hypothetical protein
VDRAIRGQTADLPSRPATNTTVDSEKYVLFTNRLPSGASASRPWRCAKRWLELVTDPSPQENAIMHANTAPFDLVTIARSSKMIENHTISLNIHRDQSVTSLLI